MNIKTRTIELSYGYYAVMMNNETYLGSVFPKKDIKTFIVIETDPISTSAYVFIDDRLICSYCITDFIIIKDDLI